LTRIGAQFLEVAIREFSKAVAKEDDELADAWLEVAFRVQRRDLEDAQA
jgi:hypothetical protein